MSKETILGILKHHKEKEFKVRELKKMLDISLQSIYRSLSGLENEELIYVERKINGRIEYIRYK